MKKEILDEIDFANVFVKITEEEFDILQEIKRIQAEDPQSVDSIVYVKISEKELLGLRDKASLYDLKKNSSRQYFQEKTKQKIRHCPICDDNFKMASYSNHIRSKSHLKRVIVLEEQAEPTDPVEKLDVEELIFVLEE